jgi:S-(hydroxymethyl)glutathione dehydrogenase / alcohol dehydrogenase
VKAAVCRAFGAPLVIEELVLDEPGEGEVIVELAACAICHSDIAFAEGAWGGDLPAVYGHEAAGVVRDARAGVSTVRADDRVVVSLLRSCGRCSFCRAGEYHLCETEFPADGRPRLRTPAGEAVVQAMHTGAFAEQVVVHESQVAVVPASLPLDVASLLSCGVLTGVGAVLDRVGVLPGSSVVVIGTGGVGVNAVQGARIAGAEVVIAVDTAPEKRAAADAFGATHAVDPEQEDVSRVVRSLTSGRGADTVFVGVGRGPVIEAGLALVRRGGTLAVLGMPPSDETFSVVGVDLVHDDRRIVGHKIGSGSGRLADVVPRLVGLYEDGNLKLDELLTGRYPLDEINEAIATAADGRTLRNVVVFEGAEGRSGAS